MKPIFIVFIGTVALLGCQKAGDKQPTEAMTEVKQKKGPVEAPVQQAQVKVNGVPTRPASQPASAPARGLPPGHPPTGTSTQPAGAASGLNGSLSGTIDLASGYASKVKSGSTLFIIVRRDAGEGKKGMLLAAKKIPVADAKNFPLNYSVTKADVMMRGTVLAGTVRVEARIDQDGDAISKQPGDIVGKAAQVFEVGAKGVNFTLDQTL
ncbi:MAG: hypothetical protein VX589_18945 [Myxococcota bacterium]|nr:hypothetical protein [Myxococcota bacterium]